MALGNRDTVKVYLSRLFKKVGVRDRFELALFGLKYSTVGEILTNETNPSGDAGTRPSSGPHHETRAKH